MDDINASVAKMSLKTPPADGPKQKPGLLKENQDDAPKAPAQRAASAPEREQDSSLFQELSAEEPASPAGSNGSISPPSRGRFLGAVEAPVSRLRAPSRASRNAFDELGADDSESDGFAPLRPRSMMSRAGILPYSDDGREAPGRELNWSRGARSSMGIREERGKVQAMENEIFRLKMRIKELEDGGGSGADSEELADAKQSCEQWKSRANLLDKDLQLEINKNKELEQRVAEFENIAKELTDMAEESAAVDAESCQVLYGIMKQLHAYNEDIVVPPEAPKTPSEGLRVLESALEELFAYWKGVEQMLEAAISKAEEADAAYGTAAAELDEQRERCTQLEHLLSVAAAPLGARPENLAAQISSLLNENHVLEGQLREKEDHHTELMEALEQTHTSALAQAQRTLDEMVRQHDGERSDVEHKMGQLQDALREQVAANETQRRNMQAASRRDYDMLRMFFRRIQNQMPTDWVDDIERELAQVMERAEAEQRSKLPLIIDLQQKYVDRLCRQSLVGLKAPAELKELRARCRSLDGILREELRRLGADQVLLAQLKVAQEQLKSSEELRRLESDSYKKRLALQS